MSSPNRAASPDRKQPRPLQGEALEKYQQHISRVQELLRERGPLPLPQLLTLAEVSRAAIERMLAEASCSTVGRSPSILPKILSTSVTRRRLTN